MRRFPLFGSLAFMFVAGGLQQLLGLAGVALAFGLLFIALIIWVRLDRS